jgi:hypothetical protein
LVTKPQVKALFPPARGLDKRPLDVQATPSYNGSRRAHTDNVPDDAAWTDPVVVPDDIRELDADVEAYHREQRALRRRRRWEHLHRHMRPATPALLVAIAVAALGFAGILIGFLGLHRPIAVPAPVTAAPIATEPIAAVGKPGGLLPDLRLAAADGRSVDIRAFRPALVALVPLHCGCRDVVAHVVQEGLPAGIRTVVVAPAARDAEVAAWPGQVRVDAMTPLWDGGGVLRDVYAASGVTVLVVAQDATVYEVVRDVGTTTPLTASLRSALVGVGVPGSRNGR